MKPGKEAGKQTTESVRLNADFFRDNVAYADQIHTLEVYEKYCALAIQQSFQEGVQDLLDVGNGGVFNYDISRIRRVVALDLFLEPSRPEVRQPQVEFRQGSALDMPFDQGTFDFALMQNLLHHIVGKSYAETQSLIRKAVSESARVLRPGGRLLVLEATVPGWMHALERCVLPLATRANPFRHPVVFQHRQSDLMRFGEDAGLRLLEYTLIPKGKYTIAFGKTVPAALVPSQMVKLLFGKPR